MSRKLIRSAGYNYLPFNVDRMFSIHLFLTLECNYRCEYCFVWKPTSNIIETVKIEELICMLKEKNYENIDIVFHGGEPTLHPDYLYITELFCKELPKCGIIWFSNGSAKITYYKKAFDILNQHGQEKFAIISYHAARENNLKFLLLLNNMQKYKNMKKRIAFMLEPKQKEKMIQMKRLLKKVDISDIEIQMSPLEKYEPNWLDDPLLVNMYNESKNIKTFVGEEANKTKDIFYDFYNTEEDVIYRESYTIDEMKALPDMYHTFTNFNCYAYQQCAMFPEGYLQPRCLEGCNIEDIKNMSYKEQINVILERCNEPIICTKKFCEFRDQVRAIPRYIDDYDFSFKRKIINIDKE
jgi:organic radical activating enzyme